MSTETAAHRTVDTMALDHYPTCPHCGNLCGRLAVKCADCGALLGATEVDLRDARAVGSDAMPPRTPGEDTEATRERGD